MTTNASVPQPGGPGKREPDRLDKCLRDGYSFTLASTPDRGLVQVTIVKPNGQPFTDIFCRLDADGALDALDRAAHVAEELRILDAERNRRRQGEGPR